jgi:hypothetical protein
MRNAYKILVEKTEKKMAGGGGEVRRKKGEETYVIKNDTLKEENVD